MKAYQLKVQIRDSHSPIWRRVIVPAGLSFSQLSVILNEVMEWYGDHSYIFIFAGLEIQVEEKTEYFGNGEYNAVDAAETMIEPYLDLEGWFEYIYDRADFWVHQVTIEKIVPNYDKNYAQVTEYKEKTPYEDCAAGLYDRAEVNEKLTHLYLCDEKSAPMTQHEIYEEVMEKGMPFKQIDGSREIPDFDDPLNLEELCGDIFSSKDSLGAYVEEAAKKGTLKDILGDFSKQELTALAKIHRLKGYSKFKKDELLGFVCQEILDPYVMRTYFEFINDSEVELLEQGDTCTIIDSEETTYDYILESGYVGCMCNIFGNNIIVTKDVRDAYHKCCDEEWKKHRKDNWMLWYHLNAAVELNGICTLDDVIKMYKQNMHEQLTLSAVTQLCRKLPENRKRFVLKNNGLILKELTNLDSILVLLEMQEGKPQYIPSIEEVKCLGEKGYLPFDRYMDALEKFFVNECDEDIDDAKNMCIQIQYIIRTAGDLQEIAEYLEAACTEFTAVVKDERKTKLLFTMLQNVWNNTHMIAERGYKPGEALPVGGKDNIIPFPGAH